MGRTPVRHLRAIGQNAVNAMSSRKNLGTASHELTPGADKSESQCRRHTIILRLCSVKPLAFLFYETATQDAVRIRLARLYVEGRLELSDILEVNGGIGPRIGQFRLPRAATTRRVSWVGAVTLERRYLHASGASLKVENSPRHTRLAGALLLR